ncbi:unnamed protein product, partial [Meganyctiphanes norvegica]
QSSAPGVCFSFPGSPRGRGGRPLTPLGQVGVNLPFSPSGCSPLGGSPPVSLSGPRGTGGPLVRPFRLVSLSPEPVSRSGPAPVFPLPFPGFSRESGLPRRPRRFQASRVETVTLGLRASGFSEEAAVMLLRAHKFSTSRQYQGVWDKFLSFLALRRLAEANVSVGVVCDFLTYQAVTMGRGYRTVSGYRSALRHPLLFACDLDVRCISSDLFLRGVFNFRPPSRAKPMPRWSLNALLNFLLEPHFEPLESASLFRLTQKTLCLLLLASGRRIGDISALSRSARVGPSGSLFLDWVPGYIPKVHTPVFQSPCPSVHKVTSGVR